MKRAGLLILCSLLLISPCLSAEEYSFDRYLSDRGGCSAHRQILDKRLKEVRSDVVAAAKAGDAQGIDLFGRRAADWSERDVQTVLAAFRRCEERIVRTRLDGRDQQSRNATIRDYEVVIAREAARIEETLREIIAADRGNSVRPGAETSGERRAGRGDAPPTDGAVAARSLPLPRRSRTLPAYAVSSTERTSPISSGHAGRRSRRAGWRKHGGWLATASTIA